MSDTPWHFVVAFDEDKIKQHGTTVEDVRAAINEIAEHNGMEEVEPGTWIVKPEAQDWMAQSLTLNLLAKRPDILRFISKCTFYEGKDGSGDFFKVMNLNRAN